MDAALGLAGGAGGEQDHPDVEGFHHDVGELVAGRRHGFAERRIALGFNFFGLAAHHQDFGAELELMLGVFHRRHQGEADHKDLELGVVDDEGDFFLGPQGGDRHRDGAQLHDAEVDGHGLGGVGHADTHPVL